MTFEAQLRAVVLGHAVADALGVPVEFSKRVALDAAPVTDMRGYGTYPVPAGAWSDDTSLSLAALDALLGGEVAYHTVMQGFVSWLTNAKYTPTGLVFDVGRSCREAITKYFICAAERPYSAAELEEKALSCGSDHERANGNGSLMRIHPFALYAYARQIKGEAWRLLIENASRLTHAHERSRVGCLIYGFVLNALLQNPCKTAIGEGLQQAERALGGYGELASYKRIFEPDFANIPRNGIKSSGYVVDTLEAALWCLLTTDSYRECVLKAVNLGEDTDSVAAVAGGLAGALYGLDAIPKEWLSALLCREEIERLCRLAADGWR